MTKLILQPTSNDRDAVRKAITDHLRACAATRRTQGRIASTKTEQRRKAALASDLDFIATQIDAMPWDDGLLR